MTRNKSFVAARPGLGFAELRKIKSQTQSPFTSSIQRRIASRLQEIGRQNEVRKLLVEGNLAATRLKAFSLLLRTSVETAEPAKVAAATWFDQKNIQLMVDNIRLGSRWMA